LAMRLAKAGVSVAIGSRDAGKAVAAAQDMAGLGLPGRVSGHDNLAAAEAGDLIIVAVPFASQVETLRAIAPAARGKVVIDTTVPLVPPKVARVQLPDDGCAAGIAARVLGPEVRLVTAFHN